MSAQPALPDEDHILAVFRVLERLFARRRKREPRLPPLPVIVVDQQIEFESAPRNEFHRGIGSDFGLFGK